MRVLFFAAWYPHRTDAMAGLFVRKHAEAVARFCDVAVLFVRSDRNVKDFDIVSQTTSGVREVYVYYPCWGGLLAVLSKCINYLRAFSKGYSYLLSHWGKPDVSQVNVLTRSGVFPWWLKKRYGIPYVVVEHWSRYLPEDFHFTGLLRKLLTRRIVADASCVMAVSQVLKDAMLSLGLRNDNFRLINNVVNDMFYDQCNTCRREGKYKILHVSCFDEPSKNMKGILDAVSILMRQREDFELHVVGYGPDYDSIVGYARELQLCDRYVFFKGEQPPHVVCEEMKESDFFVLFSNFETASVVICEALATGLPIVSSAVCQIPIMVRSDIDMLVPPRDINALAQAMLEMMTRCRTIDRNAVRGAGMKYNYNVVGQYLTDIYREAISRA